MSQEYIKEVEIKKNQLRKDFSRLDDFIAMKNPFYYRHKVTASFDKRGNKVIAGQYEPKSRRIVVDGDNKLEHKLAQKIIIDAVRLANKYKVPVFSQGGYLRHIQVRVGYHSREVMVTIVVSDLMFKGSRDFSRALVKLNPEITTVTYNLNKRDTPIVMGYQDVTSYGPGFIYDSCCGLKFKLSPNTFYQVNPEMTEILYAKAIELADLKPTDKVLDTYCGIGTITLCLAKHVDVSTGVEHNKQSILNAKENALMNKITNTHFIEADSTEYLQKLTDNPYNILFMDPPRSGSTKEFLSAAIHQKFEKIVYISCNPRTLKRDLKLLEGHYKLTKLVGVDQFPLTQHCEVIVMLERE